MNEDAQNAGNQANEDELKKQERAAGAPEGAVGAEPSESEIKELYAATGVTAPVPTDKSKKRSESNGSGAKKDSKKDDASGSAGKGQASSNSSNKSETSSASSKDGSDGGDSDSKGSKVGSEAGKDGKEDREVSGAGDKDADGVHKNESENNGAASKTGEGESEQGASGNGSASSDSEGETEGEENNGEGVKRPGKSNPEVEKRFQKLNGDLKESHKVIEDLQRQLREKEANAAKEKAAIQDPEYSIQDFRKVRDNATGEIRELTQDEAELAYRRWKEGYDARVEQRNAEANRVASENEAADTKQRELMETSVKAYDTLTSLMDEYPELTNGEQFDPEFAAEAMPIIQEAIIYQEGTEPGNPDDNLPVILGLKIDPRRTLNALKKVANAKRSLPLNGTRDNVEPRSNVEVQSHRSSDPTVNQANQLMKELNINKRF